jgi:hypothetical protein
MEGSLKVQVIIAAATDDWGNAALRMEQLDDSVIGQILQKKKLDNIVIGRTLLTVVAFEATRPSGMPC